jgi:hypothetical protein
MADPWSEFRSVEPARSVAPSEDWDEFKSVEPAASGWDEFKAVAPAPAATPAPLDPNAVQVQSTNPIPEPLRSMAPALQVLDPKLAAPQIPLRGPETVGAVAPPRGIDAFLSAFRNASGVSENVRDWHTTSFLQRGGMNNAARLASLQADISRRDARVPDQGESGLAPVLAGQIARDIVDPLSVAMGLATGPSVFLPVLKRLGSLAALGGTEAALDEAARQGARGGVDDPGAVALAAGVGAVAVPALDTAARLIASGLRSSWRTLSPEQRSAAVNQAHQEAARAAEDAGLPPEQGIARLNEIIDAVEPAPQPAPAPGSPAPANAAEGARSYREANVSVLERLPGEATAPAAPATPRAEIAGLARRELDAELLDAVLADEIQPTPREFGLSLRAEELLTPDEIETLAVRHEIDDDYFNALEALIREREATSAEPAPAGAPAGAGLPEAGARAEAAAAGGYRGEADGLTGLREPGAGGASPLYGPAPGGAKGVNPSGAYAPEPSGMRTAEGAGTDGNTIPAALLAREPDGLPLAPGAWNRFDREWDRLVAYMPDEDPVRQLNDRERLSRGLGQRVRHVTTDKLPSGRSTVNSVEEAAHVLAPLRKEAQENLFVIVTGDDGSVLRVAKAHKGTANATYADPGLIGGIAASTPGARGVWIGHNHPSGNAFASGADGVASRRIADVLRGSGVSLRGSVILAPGGRWTDVSNSTVTGAAIPPARRNVSLPVTERRLTGDINREATLDSPRSMGDYLRQLGDRRGVLLTDSNNRPVRFVEMTDKEMSTLRQGAGGGSARLLTAMDETTAAKMIGRTDSDVAAENLRRFGAATKRPLVDAFTSDGLSRAAAGLFSEPASTEFHANPFGKALAEYARDIGQNPGRSAAGAFAGGVGGATLSDEKPGTPAWFADIAFGAAAGAGGVAALRKAKISGKGAIMDVAIDKLGAAIDKLPGFGRGPMDLRDLKRRQRAMQQIINREVTDMGAFLRDNFTPSQRGQMADLIERRGIIKDLNMIHRQADELEKMLTTAAERMKALKMLPEDLEAGGYLHRYYRKHLFEGDGQFREAKRQSLSGTYAIARGTDDVFQRDYLSPFVSEVVDQFNDLTERMGKAEGAELAQLRAERQKLAKTEFHEYVGSQNGELRSFLFAKDEVPFVPGDHPLGYLASAQRVAKLGEGMAPEVKIGELQPTGRRWSVRGTKDDGILMHRDWTKAEREAWGEIGDAGYRFVRGMNEISHDLSLATLFDTVSKRRDWAASAAAATAEQKANWQHVPATQAGKGSAVRKHGALAGMYVRPDVWAGLKNYGRHPLGDAPAFKMYRDVLARWKLWKTVYNPVTHFNNTHSNSQMLLMAGYSPADLGRSLRTLWQGEGEQLVREATEDGVLDANRVGAIVGRDDRDTGLEDLARELLEQPEIPDATFVLSTVMKAKEWFIRNKASVAGAKGPWQTGAALARAAAEPALKGLAAPLRAVKPLGDAAQRLYRFEDEMFKMAVYMAERRRGSSRTEAAQAANQFFFDYADLPDALKIVRDLPIGSPFISYTYFAIPAIARNIARNPEYVLALAAAYEAVNYAGMAMEGLEPGEYWNVAAAEDELSAPWDSGRSAWGARNAVHVPFLEGHRLALGNAHALGNVFQAESGNRRADLPWLPDWWGSDIFGSSPVRVLLDVAMNEDWKGREIYAPGAPEDEKAKAIAAYIYQAWTPSNQLMPGSYHQTRILEGLANDAREAAASGEPAPIATPVAETANRVSEQLGFGQFTGLDRGEHPIVTRDALLASFGIKLRPIRFDEGADFERKRLSAEEAEIKRYENKQRREARAGRISGEALNQRLDKTAVDRDALYQRRTEIDEAEATVMNRGAR